MNNHSPYTVLYNKVQSYELPWNCVIRLTYKVKSNIKSQCYTGIIVFSSHLQLIALHNFGIMAAYYDAVVDVRQLLIKEIA